jgi:hypothetical protein
MTALQIVLFVIALCAAILVVVYGVAYLVIRRLRDGAVLALRSDVGEEEVYRVADCNFFGVLSSGVAQVRGNGLLALTSAGLRFRMLAPKRALFIPRASIGDVSNPRWFLKKSKARDLLRVGFINDRGEEDAAAWLLRDLPWWNEAVAALQAGGTPPEAPLKSCI